MANQTPAGGQPLLLDDLAGYHRDAEASFRLYFAPQNPDFVALYAGYRSSEVARMLADRIHETDVRSALAVMARVEAAFRLDYKWRLNAKKPDAVSITFRKRRKKNIRLDDIWEAWKDHHSDPGMRSLISQLRGAFNFRHWLAHGRYWQVGQKYDFQALYLLAQEVFAAFPLFS